MGNISTKKGGRREVRRFKMKADMVVAVALLLLLPHCSTIGIQAPAQRTPAHSPQSGFIPPSMTGPSVERLPWLLSKAERGSNTGTTAICSQMSRRTLLLLPVVVGQATSSSALKVDIDGAAQAIEQQCGPYLSIIGALSPGNKTPFLYRGGSRAQMLSAGLLQNEDSDLLDAETYGREGSLYFGEWLKWIEQRDDVRTKKLGHIAVANATEAGIWGDAMSCWPVGKFDYAWLSESRLLCDDDLLVERRSCESMNAFRWSPLDHHHQNCARP
jgi:hypothetical protein